MESSPPGKGGHIWFALGPELRAGGRPRGRYSYPRAAGGPGVSASRAGSPSPQELGGLAGGRRGKQGRRDGEGRSPPWQPWRCSQRPGQNCPRFTDQETEAQRGQVTGPRPHSQGVAEPGFQFRPQEPGEARSPSWWTEAGLSQGRGPRSRLECQPASLACPEVSTRTQGRSPCVRGREPDACRGRKQSRGRTPT